MGKAISKKVRRHSGRKTPKIIFNGMNKQEIIVNCLEPREYWDDWDDYRDGFRGCNDRKLIRNLYMFGANWLEVDRWNEKLKKLVARRKMKKVKRVCNESI